MQLDPNNTRDVLYIVLVAVNLLTQAALMLYFR